MGMETETKRVLVSGLKRERESEREGGEGQHFAFTNEAQLLFGFAKCIS